MLGPAHGFCDSQRTDLATRGRTPWRFHPDSPRFGKAAAASNCLDNRKQDDVIRDLPLDSNTTARSFRSTGMGICKIAATTGLAVALLIGPATLSGHADELDDQYAQLQTQLEASQGGINASRSELDGANAVLVDSQAQLERAQAALAAAQAAESSAQERAISASVALQTAEQNLEAAQDAVDAAQLAVDEQRKRVGIAAQQESQQDKSLQGIGVFLSNLKTGDINNRVQWMTNTVGTVQRELDALNAALDELEKQRDAMAAAEKAAQAARDAALAQFEETQRKSLEAMNAANEVAVQVASSQSAMQAAQDVFDAALDADEGLRNRAAGLAAKIQARNDAAAAAAAAAAQASAASWVSAQTSWVTANVASGQLQPFSVDQAMARAQSMVGNMNYGNMCLALVATFYGYSSSGVNSATDAARMITSAGQMQYDLSNIPVGALVFYDGSPAGNPFGHVAMYAGDGMIFSNGASNGGVGMMSLYTPANSWGEPIIGWSSVWLPYATA